MRPDALTLLRSRPRFGPPGARERVRALLPRLPDGVKITGSNGKGSTSHLTAMGLSALGYRTGLFISPHFLDPRERIAVVGPDGRPVPIAADDFDRVVAEAAESLPDGAQFEVLTLAAARHFAAQGLDAVVWEAGIGGLHDTTAGIPASVSVLTHVALEHTALLGNTLAAIAADKAQLATPGSTLILGPLDLAAETSARAATQATHVHRVTAPVATGLRGAHQGWNAACADAAIRRFCQLRTHGDVALDARLAAAFARARVPGRFEAIPLTPSPSSDVALWIDAAHNVSGLEVARETARETFEHRPVVLLLGVSADRDVEAMVPVIEPIGTALVVTAAHHKGAPAERLAAAATRLHPQVARDPSAALALALGEAERRGGLVFATGGLFLAAEVAAAAAGLNPMDLQWF
jgi:dihydrofolate synthase/folylpolyglutamate synthase